VINQYSWGFCTIFKNLQLLPTDEKRPTDLKRFLFSFPRIEDVIRWSFFNPLGIFKAFLVPARPAYE